MRLAVLPATTTAAFTRAPPLVLTILAHLTCDITWHCVVIAADAQVIRCTTLAEPTIALFILWSAATQANMRWAVLPVVTAATLTRALGATGHALDWR